MPRMYTEMFRALKSASK